MPKPKREKSNYNVNRLQLLRNEYIEWCILDRQHKIVAGLPTSDVQWAKLKGITDRTIRNWKNDPDFIAKYEARVKEVSLALPGGTSLSVIKQEKQDKPTKEKSEYELIKQKLVDRAMAGDKNAADLYFKTYGKVYVDEEAASRRSDFRELDTDTLYSRVLALVTTEAIEAELAKRREVVND